MQTLLLILALSPVSAAPMAVVPDEAHALKGSEREKAMFVYRSHYENLVESFTGLRIDARERGDASVASSCELSVDLRDALPESAVIEGLPLRRAQPDLFLRFQTSLVRSVAACSKERYLTRRSWETARETARDLLVRNSGTSYCRIDADCEAVELADSCSSRPAATVVTSNVTDAVLMVGLRRFLPALQNRFQQEIVAGLQAAGPKHPDAGLKWDRCTMPLWEEKTLPAVCDAGRCKVRR